MGKQIEVIAARSVWYGSVTKQLNPATGLEQVLDNHKLFMEGQHLWIDEAHFTDADKYEQKRDDKGRAIGPKVFGSYRRAVPVVVVAEPAPAESKKK